jgi:hypothetical protein
MMGKPYHGRRRRRPRRRLRYRGSGLPPRSPSYQSHGLKALYNLLIPNIRGRDRRLFFNGLSAWLALLSGAVGAVWGWGVLGPLGVVFGFSAGVTLAASFMTERRYFRR